MRILETTLTWGILFLIIFSVSYYVNSPVQICGYDYVYDNNCEL